MVATLVLIQDATGNLHDQEGHLRNAAGQKIDDQGAIEPSQDSFTFMDHSTRNSGGIIRDVEVQIRNTLVPVDFHVLENKQNKNHSLLLERAFMVTVGAVCNMQTNQLCLTLINLDVHYDPIKVPQTAIDYHYGDTISRQDNYSIACWAEDILHESYALDTELPEMRSDEYDKDNHREKSIEYHGLTMDDRGLLHTSSADVTSTSIDSRPTPSIDSRNNPSIVIRYKHLSEEYLNNNTDYDLISDEFGVFLFLCHGFLERRTFLICMAPGPPWMHICILVRMKRLIAGIQVDSFDFVILRFPHERWRFFRIFPSHSRGNLIRVFSVGLSCALPGLSSGVAKSSLLPRTFVVPRGRTALVLAVRVSTCLAREPMSFSCSLDFILKAVNISSKAAVLALALTADTFSAGVVPMLSLISPSTRVCWLSVAMSDRASAAES
ncbi:hypothetical protein F2Q68_00039995 [Brassica cretica]|uniref:Uncharacterized protein n=1 Tax=Brassica cretica TaxID=69181 RepID=A0A8S9MHP8_BRACR|nr:hypothetical protein F2Q68_00039995 [Brassica cretica]